VYLGRYEAPAHQYGFLQGLGESFNQKWVNGFQNPFNVNVLFPAAELAKRDKAAAYAMLAPAFAKIQADAVAFVNQNGHASQATITGWQNSDFGLIQGFLRDWSQAGPVPAGSTAPVSIPLVYDDQAPAITGGQVPAIYGPVSSPGGGATYLPGAPASVTVQTGGAAAGAGSMLEEWAPWIAGAAVLGFLLSSRGKG
jgi:hypothetical protein